MSTDKRLAIKPALNQFNGGEISPQLEGRYDWDKYNYSAKICKNFIPTIEGSLKRRGGSHFVALKRGSGYYTFKIYVKVDPWEQDENNDYPSPVLTINGETVTLHNTGGFFLNDTFVTDELTYLDGTKLSYNLSCSGGYLTKTGTIIVNINQSDVNLKITKSSADTVTVNFITPSSATVTLNGTTTKTITDTVGTSVSYSISFLAGSTTGNITLTEDKNYYVYKAGSILVVTDSDIFLIDYPTDGSIYLPASKIRYIGVGAGGGDSGYTEINYYAGGGSGAGCDIVLDITEGEYEYKIGAHGGQRIAGNPTYLKFSNNIVVNNGGGGAGWQGDVRWGRPTGGAGGINTINNSLLVSSNWAKNGNAGGLYSSGASVYSGYGAGGAPLVVATNGYLYLSFVGE